MKKFLALLLVVLSLVSLGACASSANSGDKTSPTATAAATEKATDKATDDAAAATTNAIPENEITGDPSAKDAIVIWGWNTDFTNLQKVLTQFYPDIAKRIVLVNAGGTDYYQDKIDVILQDKNNELYPDIMLLEVDYVKKYVNSDYLMNITDLGITSADTANMYSYNLQLGTDDSGATKALFWQATPGSFQVRADLAQKYLGTTNSDELYTKYFSSWDKIVEASATVNKASGGKVDLLSGYNDVIRVFLNSARKVGWYDKNDTIKVDDSMLQYMDLSKTLYEAGTTFNTTQWGTDWAALKDGDGTATEASIAFVGCPWYTYWCLTDTWEKNTILVEGPAQFYWGGTGLAVTKDCADKEAAATILKACTCDTEVMKAINAANGDYVNNKEVISYLLANNLGNSTKMYGDQNLIKFYSDKCESIDASTVTDVDQRAQALFQTQVDEYAMGKKDRDTAVSTFMTNLQDLYSYLKIG